MDKKLFKTVFRVHFKPGHPKAEEFAFGRLMVMLYAETAKEAGELAMEIASPISYLEIDAGKSSPIDEDNISDLEISCLGQAATVGVGFALEYWLLGTDEYATLGDWPGLIPLLNAP